MVTMGARLVYHYHIKNPLLAQGAETLLSLRRRWGCRGDRDLFCETGSGAVRPVPQREKLPVRILQIAGKEMPAQMGWLCTLLF